MNNRITADEADVIDAAIDFWELCEMANYGAVSPDLFKKAEKEILAAVSALHNANDGRWRRPKDL